MKLYLSFLPIFLATLSSSAQTNRFDFIVGSGVYSTPARRPVTTSYVLFTSITDFGFPLSAKLYKKATRRLSYGIKLGSFIFPDYPIIGNNIGIQLRYSLF